MQETIKINYHATIFHLLVIISVSDSITSASNLEQSFKLLKTQEISTAYNAAIIELDSVIYDAIVSGTLEAGLRAREFCHNAKQAAAEEDAAAQSAIDGKGGRAAKGGGRRMCKSL